jgi:hypothetical protein
VPPYLCGFSPAAEAELDAALQRGRYDRHGTTRGRRHGRRARQLIGSFGPVTQCLLPCAETACMLFWALLASGQIALRRVNGWDTFHVPPAEHNLDLAA